MSIISWFNYNTFYYRTFLRWNFSVGEHDLTFIKGQRQIISRDHGNTDDEVDIVTCDPEGQSVFFICIKLS